MTQILATQDGASVTESNPLPVKLSASGVAQKASNGTTLDDWRNNTEGTLLASAARTATNSSDPQTNHNARGVFVILSVTAASGAGGLAVRILGTDPISGGDYYLNQSPTVVTATGRYVYELYPGASSAAAASSLAVVQRTSGSLPRSFKVQVQHSDASSYTYSVAYSLTI